MTNGKLLWVDDEIELLKAHIIFLEKKGYEIDTVTNGFDAVEYCGEKSYDLILCPTCPTPSFKLGQKVDDPLAMYLSDLFTVFVNLARIPSISVPCGHTSGSGVTAGITKGFNGEFAAAAAKGNSESMPVGIQFAGPMFSEAKILRIAQAWEEDHPGCGCPVAE